MTAVNSLARPELLAAGFCIALFNTVRISSEARLTWLHRVVQKSRLRCFVRVGSCDFVSNGSEAINEPFNSNLTEKDRAVASLLFVIEPIHEVIQTNSKKHLLF